MKKHAFSVEAASIVGINAAILLEHISFWVHQNAAAGRNIRDGAAWTYGSVREIAERFPYMTEKQVRGALDRLQAEGLVKVGNFNRVKYDRTRWFSLTHEGRRIAAAGAMMCEDEQTDLPVKAEGTNTQGVPIPSTKTDLDYRLKTKAEALRARLKNA